MWGNASVSTTIWTLIDQCLVSVFSFGLSLLLARQLAPAEYGTFVLLTGGILTLQLINATLLFHPLSVRLVLAEAGDKPRLLRASILLLMALCGLLCPALVAVLLIFRRADLIAPMLVCFLCWQLQEGMRRGLLSGFRPKTAAIGDVIRYCGQLCIVLVLLWAQVLTLTLALYAIAAAAVLAAIFQASQLPLRSAAALRLRETIADYWKIGGCWSLGTGLLAQMHLQGLVWGLAYVAGTATVAAFQAANNIVNLSNPIIIGLCNVLPQIASQASAAGNNRMAWRATRRYAMLATPVLFGFSLCVFAVPETVLRIVYGEHSVYVTLTVPLRILIVSGLISCAVEIIISYLHGIREARLALIINAIGALTVAILIFPALEAGLIGACLTLVAVNIARLFAARVMLLRSLSGTWPALFDLAQRRRNANTQPGGLS